MELKGDILTTSYNPLLEAISATLDGQLLRQYSCFKKLQSQTVIREIYKLHVQSTFVRKRCT